LNPMELNKKAVRTRQAAYALDNIIFLPHHNLKGSFVAPGHKTGEPRITHVNKLREMGARQILLDLWPRSYS